jgi:hypothetical protein
VKVNIVDLVLLEEIANESMNSLKSSKEDKSKAFS